MCTFPGVLYILLWLILLLGFLSGVLLYGGRLVHSKQDRLPPAPIPDSAAGPLSVSVVIPARNEEHRIPRLLESLQRQVHPCKEIIVVDDDSRDGTAAVCRGYGVTVLPAGTRPAGWMGKTWACSVGAAHSTGELLLFLDADVELSDRAIVRLHEAHRQEGGAVSVQPYHRTRRLYESFSALFNAQAATAVGVGKRARGLFGPCIMIDRGSYNRCGGHEAIRDSVLDDVDLGAACASRGVPLRTYLGGRAIRYRMYPEGFLAMVNGWTKNFLRGAGATPPRVLLLQSLWIIGAVTAFVQTAISLADSGVAVFPVEQAVPIYLVFALLIGLSARFFGNFGLAVALTFPLHLLFFGYVMLRALWIHARGGRVDWRGREVCPGRAGCRDGSDEGA
ncbi:MAG: glycosyltransferase [bacterium]